MLHLLYKSLRFALFGFLLFAGATDMFSVDLDQDGESETEATVAFDHVAAVRKSLAAAEDYSAAEVSTVFVPGVRCESNLSFQPQPPTGCSLSSPQMLVPLRT